MTLLTLPVDGPFRRLDPTKLSFSENACDLCGSAEADPHQQVSFLGTTFRFDCCRACGLVYQNPLLDGKSRNYVYETLDYWSSRRASADAAPMLNYYDYLAETHLRERNARLRIEWMRPLLPEGGMILDIGCSDGLFVDALSKAGYRATGIDVSAAMIAAGRERYGVDIRQADFEDSWDTDARFDAVTCFATLSNFRRPSRVFAEIQRHLNIGGRVFFNYGDRGRIVSRLLGRRLYLYRPTVATIYTRSNVEAYCAKSGLRVEETVDDVQIMPLARLLNFLGLKPAVWALRALSIEDACLKMAWPTGYAAHAVRVS